MNIFQEKQFIIFAVACLDLAFGAVHSQRSSRDDAAAADRPPPRLPTTTFSAPPAGPRALITIDQTEFYFYNREDREDGTRVFPNDAASLEATGFDSGKATVIAMHGFQADRFNEGQMELRKGFLDNMDVNYFIVDWSACSNSIAILYPVALNCALEVGGYLGQFIKFLLENGLNMQTLHVIGHSLGAHGVSMISNSGLKVPRITGLDPTQVLFWDRPLNERLDPSDADFVDVIHTNVYAQGWDKLLGDTDFFPHGGDDQPDCGFADIGCNHEMSYTYMSKSLYNNDRYPGISCQSLQEANESKCNGTQSAYMGDKSIDGDRGIFYVDVKKST